MTTRLIHLNLTALKKLMGCDNDWNDGGNKLRGKSFPLLWILKHAEEVLWMILRINHFVLMTSQNPPVTDLVIKVECSARCSMKLCFNNCLKRVTQLERLPYLGISRLNKWNRQKHKDPNYTFTKMSWW